MPSQYYTMLSQHYNYKYTQDQLSMMLSQKPPPFRLKLPPQLELILQSQFHLQVVDFNA